MYSQIIHLQKRRVFLYLKIGDKLVGYNYRNVSVIYRYRGSMLGYILLALIILFAFSLNFIRTKTKDKFLVFRGKSISVKNLIFKGLSALLFFLYIPHLFSVEKISLQVGLDTGYFPPIATAFIVVLKWLTYLSNAIIILLPFFEKRQNVNASTFLVPLIILLNCIFFNVISITITGNTEISSQIIVYASLMLLTGGICFERLIKFIREKGYLKIPSKILSGFLHFLTYALAFMPLYTIKIFIGEIGEEVVDFTITHRIYIYFSFIFPAIAFLLMKNRSYNDRRYFLVMLTLSGFMQYFYYDAHRSGLSIWPLHLCNTAIVIMFFVYVFKIESAFYFTYLVNVPGALFAILLPNSDNIFSTMSSLHFWYNHWYAFFLPLLGVGLGIFKRPKFKMIIKAILAFTVYVFIAATLNAWLNNSPINVKHEEVDFFFLYGNYLINKLPWAYPIKANFVLRFPLGDTMMTYYYLYNICVFVFYIGFIFLTWWIYSAFYNVSDEHTKLNKKKALIKIDMLNLLKELNGRPLTQPLRVEGKNMIKINNFSKKYKGSNRYAVKNLNLEIKGGEVFGFIGHNGAGKSTTIKSLVGIQSITEGNIEIEGYDMARQPLEAKLNIGYVSDNHAVYEQLTGREYVEYVADLYKVPNKETEERLNHYAKMFGLTDALDYEIKSYSHGMKQKINVISSLIHNPKIWVLDEPFTGLDPTSTRQIKEVMKEHAKNGNIVFFSSHVIEVVEKICDRIAIICAGELCVCDTVENINKQHLSVEDLYLKYAKK